jgi:hypothetical protein
VLRQEVLTATFRCLEMLAAVYKIQHLQTNISGLISNPEPPSTILKAFQDFIIKYNK